MKYMELLARVPDEWHLDFLTFITTGDAGDAFFTFLDEHRETQEAVEVALAAQVRNLERFANERDLDTASIAAHLTRMRNGRDTVRETSSKLSTALLQSVALESRQRQDVVRSVAAALSRHDRSGAIEVLDEIRKTLI